MPNKSKRKPIATKYPMVSVCTPTFNRRPFIPFMLECFKLQDYPKSRVEWIIVDDGTDKVEDLIKDANIPQIKYFPLEERMILGKKRNFMHEHCSGSIIVYMDDDDYYPPERISHAVETLKNNPDAQCVGSSMIHVYFKDIRKIYQFGPYGENHATAGTFAFRKTLLETSSFDDNAAIAEEKKFLKDYTVPFAQLDPMKTILVFSHIHNTFDKKKLIENPNPQVTKETKLKIGDFVKNEIIKDFIINKVDKLLSNYKEGDPKNKPEVLEQMEELIKLRDEMERKNQEENGPITLQVKGKEPITLNSKQIKELLNSQNTKIIDLQKKISGLELELNNHKQESENAELVVSIRDKRIKELEAELEKLKINEFSEKNIEINLP